MLDITVLKDPSIRMKMNVPREIIVLKAQPAQSLVPQVHTEPMPVVEPFPPARRVPPANTAQMRVSPIQLAVAVLDTIVQGDRCLPLPRTTFVPPVIIVPGHALSLSHVHLEQLVLREPLKHHLAPRVHTSRPLVRPHA